MTQCAPAASSDHEALVQKVAVLTGSSFFSFTGSEVLGIPALTMSDGPVGAKASSQHGGAPSLLLPNASMLGATWSPVLIERAGRLLGLDARRQGIDVLLGPTINIQRSPLGGRFFECFSEDPLLTGRIAAAYVAGVQAEGVGTCLKHFVANDSETDRRTVDVRVAEAPLREIYMLPFEIAHEASHPTTVMSAYNRVNGTPMSEHHWALTEVLKTEWGFKGLAVSDFFAPNTTVETILGGLDMVLPGPAGPWGQALVEAVERGDVPRWRIDDAVNRLRHVLEQIRTSREAATPVSGLLDPDASQRCEELRTLTAAGITVLRNNGVLPLTGDENVTLAGTSAVETLPMGGGSSELTPPHRVSVADGLASRLGDRLTVVSGPGLSAEPPTAQVSALRDPVTDEPGMHVRVSRADGQIVVDRHVSDSRTVLGWAGELTEDGMTASVAADVVLDGPVQTGVIGIADWNVSFGESYRTMPVGPATGTPGEALLAPPRAALADAVAGPFSLRAELALRDTRPRYVGLIARRFPGTDDEEIARAVEAAADTDVAVVVVGTTADEDTESHDRTTLRLPGRQDELVSAVAAVAKRTVVVINSGSPVLMPWIDAVDGIVWAGLGGQEAGDAVAACLLGELEPSGRLSASWPAADGECPGWNVTPVDGTLVYDDGVHVGYRGYAADHAPAPAFWFGEGLGYGTWQYSDAAVTSTDGMPAVTVTITNTSSRRSREVVQAYLRPTDPKRPTRLVGFAEATVGPGDSAHVMVPLDYRSLRRWDVPEEHWSDEAEPGEILLARSLKDVRAVIPMNI